jgi:hypothetical protein
MNVCPVCGYNELPKPAYDHSGYASFEICPCCGTQFGYQDARRPHESLRAEWVAKGLPWHSRVFPQPPGWDPEKQLRFVTQSPDQASGSSRDDTGARRR